MRRLLIPALLVAVGLSGIGSADAAILVGTPGPDRLNGTSRADQLYGLGGNDRLQGRAAGDLLDGGLGRDLLFGGGGADGLVSNGDRRTDTVACGSARDIVNADLRDRVTGDCETVSRQLSRDSGTSLEAQHETQVEPDSFSFGSTIVTVFQSGRFAIGGAESNGFATSKNGARTWRSGRLPGLSSFSAVSDPVVGYDALRGWWLAASLGSTFSTTAIVVNRSRDGLAWRGPVDVARGRDEYDKEWIVCDNWSSSRFRGRCYVSYMNFTDDTIETRRSTDGGRTWSAPAAIDASGSQAIVNGVQNVVRPNGNLLLVFSVFGALDGNEIAAARSTDGGLTFGAPAQIASLEGSEVSWFRAPPFASADVDAAGTVYVTWRDCRFSQACSSDILLAASRDGMEWTEPTSIPIGFGDAYHFVPAIAVDPATSGASARIAVLYHSIVPSVNCEPECIEVNVKLTSSRDGGTTWTPPARLNAVAMRPHWMADTSLGRMLGDYVSVSWVRGRPVPVFSLAAPPSGETFRQAIFATTRVR